MPNLMMTPNLAEMFGAISGFSDHTLGTTAPVVATTLGAKVIEKKALKNLQFGNPLSFHDIKYNLISNI